MPGINYLAVVVAAVAALVVGAVWYSPLLFGKAYMKLRGMNADATTNRRPPAGELIAEFVRYLVIAFVLALFVVRLGVVGLTSALELGLWLWFGFQAMLLLGSVIH